MKERMNDFGEDLRTSLPKKKSVSVLKTIALGVTVLPCLFSIAQTDHKPEAKKQVAPKVLHLSPYMRRVGLLYLQYVQAREDAFHNANGRDEEESILKDDSPFNRAITNLQQDIELNTNPRLAGDVEFIHILGLASLTATIADHGVLLGKISDKDLAAESYCEVFAMESVKSGVLQEDECLKAVDGQQDTNEKATDDPHSQFQQLRDDLTHQGHAVPSSDTNGSAQPQKENISGEVAMGLLFNKTVPVYPPIAKAARVSGTVVLEATISKTGVIEDLHVISGPAMLIQAALDAVRTWQYRPYLVNGEPVEVETTVNVVFTLGG